MRSHNSILRGIANENRERRNFVFCLFHTTITKFSQAEIGHKPSQSQGSHKHKASQAKPFGSVCRAHGEMTKKWDRPREMRFRATASTPVSTLKAPRRPGRHELILNLTIALLCFSCLVSFRFSINPTRNEDESESIRSRRQNTLSSSMPLCKCDILHCVAGLAAAGAWLVCWRKVEWLSELRRDAARGHAYIKWQWFFEVWGLFAVCVDVDILHLVKNSGRLVLFRRNLESSVARHQFLW